MHHLPRGGTALGLARPGSAPGRYWWHRAGHRRARPTRGGHVIENRRFINYPTGNLLAVADDAATAARAVAALEEAGWAAAHIEQLSGPAAADAFDATGAGHGLRARLRRLVQFSLMDQLPDLAWYQAAAREGRVVMIVPAGDGRAGARAAAILAAAGCHFINRFGRFQTEELLRWHGPEPDVRNLMRR